jgi:sialic acid synthase SpsE
MAKYVEQARNAHKQREHLREVHPPDDLRRFIGAAEKISSQGTTFERVKRVLPIEEDVRKVSRQSVTTTRPLPPAHRVTRADLTIKRPGTGIPPYEINQVLGRLTRHAVEADVPLRQEDLG